MANCARTATTSASQRASQRASLACESCRARKIKCDAQFAPHDQGCGPCRRSGQNCLLDPLSDGRRSVSLKFVDKLQQRIQTLEALSQGTSTSASDGSRGPARLNSRAQTARAPAGDVSRRHSNTIDATQMGSARGATGHPRIGESASATSQEPSRDVSPRFYGATSQPHISSPSAESTFSHVEEHGPSGIDIDPNATHVRDNLLQGFFKYQDLLLEMVDKDTFLAQRADGRESQWYSSFLEHAMLACSSRLSTSRSVRAMSTRFFELAKAGVCNALSEPSRANLAGFLILCEFESTRGNNGPAWMYLGIACRMVPELGLHKLASSVDSDATPQEMAESRLSYNLTSCCLVFESIVTLYLGRPSSIPPSIAQAVHSRNKSALGTDSTSLKVWVGLCEPMSKITQVLNEQPVPPSDISSTLHKLSKDLDNWLQNLPPELQYNEASITSMDLAGYGLHTQYCKVQILTRQAITQAANKKKRSHSEVDGEGFRASCDESDAIIFRYAIRVARLVVTYREAFGLESLPVVVLGGTMVAATAMIRHINKPANVADEQVCTTWFGYLIRCLESAQLHFPIVRRMLDSVRQICRSGPLYTILHSSDRDAPDGLNQDVHSSGRALNSGAEFSHAQGDSSATTLLEPGNGPEIGDLEAFFSDQIHDSIFDFTAPENYVC